MEHKEHCKFRIAMVCPVGVACEHGFDVCPICDTCTCGSAREDSLRANLREVKYGELQTQTDIP